MAPTTSSTTLSFPGNPAGFDSDDSKPLTDVFNRSVGQKPKRKHAALTRKLAFTQKTRAFAGKIT